MISMTHYVFELFLFMTSSGLLHEKERPKDSLIHEYIKVKTLRLKDVRAYQGDHNVSRNINIWSLPS